MELPEVYTEINEKVSNNDITVELVCSTIKSFVDNLPYSIDPLSTKFVPAILYNAIPKDRDQYYGFREEKEITLFYALKSWPDTRKSAYSIQLCVLLQDMLLNGERRFDDINKDEIHIWGLNELDGEQMKKTILDLHNHYHSIISAQSIEEREQALLEVYQSIKTNYGRCLAKSDLDMWFYFKNIEVKPFLLETNEENYIQHTLESDYKPPKCK